MKQTILLTLIMIISLSGISQTPEINHEKYWYYRYRMKEYFINHGADIYHSLVGARRNSITGSDLRIANDQTVDMGWYMGILAMEYHLLNINGIEGDEDDTLTELYHLLNAFDRLEKCENKLYAASYPALIDGFFARKDAEIVDVTVPFDEVLSELNHNLTSQDGFGSKPPGHPTYINTLSSNQEDVSELEMSQDQLIHLLIGFASIKRAFQNEDNYFYDYISKSWRSFNFHQRAIDRVHLMTIYAANSGYLWGPEPWVIYRPDHVTPVWNGGDLGGFMLPYSYGLAEAANYITGGLYHDGYSLVAYPTWLSISHGVSGKDHNNVMELILGTIGNSWTQLTVNGSMPSDYFIYNKSFDKNHDYFYIPFYRYLHQKDSPYERNSHILATLNDAPSCGPYRYEENGTIHFDYCDCDVPAKAGPGWAAHNRYRRTIEEANGSGSYDEKGNFPGLDYMITFNLYRLLHGGSSYYNMMKSNLNQIYPYQQNGTWYGIESNPANLRTFESFECNSEIETNANGDGSLNLIASNSIKLTPGFHVYQGAHFSAKVEEFDCWEAGGNGNRPSYFHDNGYVYNYNPDPMEVLDEDKEDKSYRSNNLNEEELFESKLFIFPNPAQNQIQIQVSDFEISIFQLIIRDVYGNTAFIKPNYQSGESLDISALSNGIYIAEAVIDGRVYQEKFVVL